MPTGPALVTVEEFADYLQVESSELERGGDDLLVSASDLVRNRGLGQRIDLVEDDVVELYGAGTGLLLLPEVPVHSVTEVRLLTAAGELDEPLTAGTDYRLEAGHDGARAILRRRPAGAYWPNGDPVTVTYSHGYRLTEAGSGELDAPLVPATIKLVVMRVAARGIANPLGLTNITAGRVSQGFGQGPDRGATLTAADLADLAPWLPGTDAGSR